MRQNNRKKRKTAKVNWKYKWHQNLRQELVREH